MKKYKALSSLYLVFIGLPLLLAIPAYKISGINYKFRDYVSLKFPLYHWAYELSLRIQVKGLQSHSIGNVHVGKLPWLFYFTQSDGNSFLDFMDTPTPKIQEKWKQYLSQQTQKPYGIEAPYFLIIPPNKERIYPEKTRFPFLKLRSERKGNYLLVTELLKEDFPEYWIDLEEILQEGKVQAPTYYSGDTHWNDWGAYLAHVAILQRINRHLGTKYEVPPANAVEERIPGKRDLVQMLNGADNYLGLSVGESPNHAPRYSPLCCPELDPESNYTVYKNSRGQGILWVVGDSFSEALEAYFPQYFHTTVFLRNSPIPSETKETLLKKYSKPDIIIEEHVERYLPSVVR